MKYPHEPWLTHYDPAVERDLDLPEVSLKDHLNKVFAEIPHHHALHFLGITLTYGDLTSYSNRFAQALLSNGCKPGDVVGINLPNIPQYLIAQLGILKAGCSASGVSPLLTAREMAYQLSDAKMKALVTLDAIFEKRLNAVTDQLPDLKTIIGTPILDFLPKYKQLLAKWLKKVPSGTMSPVPGKKVLTFRQALSDYPDQDPAHSVTPDDHCLIQYTGGTTGTPKGAVLTHRNVMSQLAIVVNWLQMNPGKEVILSGFPFFHIAGLALGLGSMYQGNAQILVPDPRNTRFIVQQMAKFKPTILVNVPSLYMMLLEEPAFRKLDLSRLVFCLSAASPFPANTLKELESVIGEGKLVEAYGMTECSALVTCNPRLGVKKTGSVGLPLSNTILRLMDLDTGDHDVPVGEEGEIVVSGPQVMKGYLNRPDETSRTLREHEGTIWLHTGDIGRMDEDGYFSIVDRSKDMLNVGGFKVFSREVEDKLYEHPAIEFCAVVGVPNPKRVGTEVVKLVYQPCRAYKNRDAETVNSSIIAFARENCAPYKVPKIIEQIEAMPLTSVGKVDKKALRRSMRP
ncbi:MAG: AMP-binding protein [Desulfomonilaceae bacterium]|nr:AMP-binding protein [Desulfomonilaceae bacterium]